MQKLTSLFLLNCSNFKTYIQNIGINNSYFLYLFFAMRRYIFGVKTYSKIVVMKKLYIAIIFLFSFTTISSQNPFCDTLRGYKVGANMNDSIPYFPLNMTGPLGLSYSNYHLLYSDISQMNDDYLISSIALFNFTNSLAPRNFTYNLDFPKLHFNNTVSNTYRDVKYERLFKDRVFSHTPINNGSHILLSGTVADSTGLDPVTGVCNGCNTKGMIMRTTINGGNNNPIILTESGENPWRDGDVILKTVETPNFYFAVGYKILTTNISGLTPVRQGILYVIDKNVYGTRQGNVYQCASAPGNTNTGVRLFRIHNIVADIIVEPDESTIFVSGAVDIFNGGRGFIGKLDLNADVANFIYFRSNPWLPSPNNNNTIIFNAMQRSRTMPGMFYAVARLKGNHAPRSRLGLVRFDSNLNLHLERGFDLDFGPGSQFPLLPGWIDVFPTNLEIDNAENIYIGAYMKDFACLPTVSSCLYKHFTLIYNESSPDIHPSPLRWVQNVNGFKDYGFVQLDNDPLAMLGGAVNSMTTLNKIPRTIALNQALDTLHIAYLLEDLAGSHKNIIYHYKRPTSLYTTPNQFDNCAGIICSREPFNATADTTNFQLWETRTYMSLNSTGIRVPNYLNGDVNNNVYEVFDCNISVTNTNGKWHEEYPVTCKQRIYDSATGCNFWKGIRIYSGSDTLCSSLLDTLYLISKSPFGINTFEWSELSNPNNILSTAQQLDIHAPGDYQVICTRQLSDGSSCQDTFVQKIYPPQHSAVVAAPSLICNLDNATLSVNANNIVSYEWRRWTGSSFIVVGNNSSYTTDVPSRYTVVIEYTHGCKEELEYDLKREGLTISQNITGTFPNQTLEIEICNLSNQDISNVEISTVLSDPFIRENGAMAAGWTLIGGQYRYTLATIPAGTPTSPICRTITMPIRTNQCKTNLLISGTYAGNPCPTAFNTREYWSSNNWMTIIQNKTNGTVKCSTASHTYCAVPLGATFQWFRDNVAIAGASGTGGFNCAQYAATTNGLYRVEISQNNCTKSDEDNLKISNIDFTTINVHPRCTMTQAGIITVNATGGHAPYEYQGGSIAYQSSNVFAGLGAGTHTIMVRDANGCVLSKNVQLNLGQNTVNFTDNITHETCNNDGRIEITNPSTTGTCDPSSYTYLWSNGETTSTISNLAAGPYTVTVTDCDGCTVTRSFLVELHSPIVVDVNTSLVNCSTVLYTATASAGTPLYTYRWVATGLDVTVNPIPLSTFITDLVLHVTDGAGCKQKVNVWNGNSKYLDLTNPLVSDNASLPSVIRDKVILLPHSFTITKPWTLAQCEVLFTTAGGQMTLASNALNDQAGLHLDTTWVHTCKDSMARGIIMTKTGDYIHARGSTFEDMFAAIAIEPANGHTFGTYFLPLLSNTFKNNYSCIRILDPDAIFIEQRRTGLSQSYTNTFWTNNTFIGSNSLKPYRPNSYPSSINHLEPATFTAANTSTSYAGYIGNYKGELYFFNSGFTSPAAPLPTFFTNLANGILTHNGKIGIHNAKFENIQSTNVNLLHNGNAVFALGQNFSNQGIYIQGYNTWSSDIDNVRHVVNIQDMHLTLWGLKMSNIRERGVGIFLTSSVPNRYIDIQGNQIAARMPIHAELQNNHTLKIVNNQLSDIIPLNGTANTNGALVNVQGVNGTLASGIVDGIANNILTVNYSRFGIRMNTINGVSSTVRYPIQNNTIKILNSTSAFTHAGMQIINANNYNITGNIVHMATGSQTATQPGTVLAGFPNNAAPIGIWTDNIQNILLSCNSFYTRTGTFHNNSHINFELLTNNYATKDHGVIFRSFTGGSVIRGMSNKFYCGLISPNFMKNLTTGNFVDASFGGATPIAIPTTCGSLPPFCTSNPAGTPFYSYYPSRLNPNIGFDTSMTAPAADNSCAIYCNLPKLAQAMPAQTGLEPTAVLYPNPSKGSFKIKLENMDNDIQKIYVEILDVQGRAVYQEENCKVDKYEAAIDTKLNPGYYLVRIHYSSGLNLTKKLMIE